MDPVVIIGEAIAGQSAALRKHMGVLAQDLQRNTFDLAEDFALAQESHCYLEWGFASLGEYASTELGIKSRKSQYLSRVIKVMRACGVQRSDFEPVGITKLRSITSLDPETTYFNQETKQHEDMAEHITALVAEAVELSTKEVEERVAHLKGMDGPNAMLTKSYSVTKSCYEDVIQPCYESIRKRLGSAGRDDTGQAMEYSDGAVIECLAAEYNADPRNYMEETNELGTEGTPIPVDCPQESSDTLSQPRQPFVLPAEN